MKLVAFPSTLLSFLIVTLPISSAHPHPTPNSEANTPPFLKAEAQAAFDNNFHNAVTCGIKNPAINTAIDRFCYHGSFKDGNSAVVPSKYTEKGVKFKGIHVQIAGHCDPPQWVPTMWCEPQFHAICAHSDELGFGSHRFGDDACQQWIIGRA